MDEVPDEEVATWGTREDGSPKGRGYFGKVERNDGTGFSTELSRSRDVDGKPLHYPLIVPTLTHEELLRLVNDGPDDDIDEKALAHAEARLKAGKSPFAEKGEQMPIPPSPDEEMKEGFIQ